MGVKPVTELDSGRFDVCSADGTSIAVWVDGEGPALVLVHGSIADHTTFEPFVAVLREELATSPIGPTHRWSPRHQRVHRVVSTRQRDARADAR
jgi:hypothetical protein